jgi:hypothetical protein
LSAYERRRKAPSLDVTERLMWAAGCDLGIVTRVEFSDHFAPRIGTFHVPDRLWRVEVPMCFAKVVMPDLLKRTRQGLWDLGDRTDRRRLYEMLLVLGAPEQIMRWVEGALLVDLWRELELPTPVRAAWASVVQAGAYGPTDGSNTAIISGRNKQYRVDLQGRSHFNTRAGRDVPTPHYTIRRRNPDPRSPSGWHRYERNNPRSPSWSKLARADVRCKFRGCR